MVKDKKKDLENKISKDIRIIQNKILVLDNRFRKYKELGENNGNSN